MRSKFSTTDGGTDGLPETVLVGTILRPHGIQGEVTVALWSDNQRRFAPGVEFRATSPAASRPAGPAASPAGAGRPAPARRERLLRIERCSPYKGGLRVAFTGIADREAAESLRGLELRVPLADVPDAPPGTYYVFELIGCRCVDESDGDIGKVVDIHEDGGGTLLEVESDGTRSVIPFVEAFVVRIDRESRRIDLRLPEGLLATCAFKS
jgi:16S rRNA processing protein RimM